MTFSACCITKSRAKWLLLLQVVFAGAFSLGRASAQDTEIANPDVAQASSFPALTAAIAANTLELEGKIPFHLRLTFQIYDLSGKPQEQGTVDEWWAGPAGSYIEIAAPSLGTLHSLSSDALPNDEARRSLYLVREMLETVRAPYGATPTKGKLVSEKRTNKKVVMNCMYVEPTENRGPASFYRTACVDVSNEAIRIVSEPSKISLRNRLGKFGGTHVALDVQVLFVGRPAVTGHVEKLDGFDPAHSPVVLDRPASSSSATASKSVAVPASLLSSKKISGNAPSYPPVAIHTRISGAVILSVHITEAGTIGGLLPIASSDPLLTNAAMTAVKGWIYQPYLLNGKPVAIDTTVTVNFNLYGR